MKTTKIKIPQYLVRGKRRDYTVLVFPKKKWLWAYYEDFDERYEIDGDPAAYQQIKHALAALIVNPGKIAYFPIHDPNAHKSYAENYDAVITRPELQLRQSEWIALRRQLDKAHQIKSFELLYEPEKMEKYYEQFSKSIDKQYKLWNRADRRKERLIGQTVFFSFHKGTCYEYHHAIIREEQSVLAGYGDDNFANYICEIGYMITPGLKRRMIRDMNKCI